MNPKAAQGHSALLPGEPTDTCLPADADTVELTGTVDLVIFHNEENGYTVLRLLSGKSPQGGRAARRLPCSPDAVTCVGHLLKPRGGVQIKLTGRWVNNPRFGRQFVFDAAEEMLPATSESIRLYLSSGLIKGVGEGMAGRIVKLFGDDTIRVLDEEPERLLKVHGIGRKSLDRICGSWAEHRAVRDLMLFLQPHGITPAYAMRIYRAYGVQALEVVRENPYRLAMDIHGIGFVTADAAAHKLGFESGHPLRVQAGTLYVLQKSIDDGNVYLPEEKLLADTGAQLNLEPEFVAEAIASLEGEERIVREEMDGETAAYLSRYYHCESKTASYLQRLIHSPRSVSFADADGTVDKVAGAMSMTLAPEQCNALCTVTRSKIMVLTGGPGTGKTTIINAVIRLFSEHRARILLAAPTGRAAKRMAEACAREACTIHRLLEYSPKEDGFARNEDRPLACGLLVVDESSMMDCLLFYHLLKAVPLGATLVLVGDVHQLPSVGPGNVLADIIASGIVPVVELTEIFRQSAESEIICNAHQINHGTVPSLESNKNRLSDFYFIHQNDPEKAADIMVDLVRNHIPRRFGLNPMDDIQVLTPMHKGAVGAGRMNVLLQDALNPNGLEVRRGERAFRLHDKVMQLRNNYDKDVFNGDLGRIVFMDAAERALSVNFDDRVVPYDFNELDELVPAYAISIHKSQGSEYGAVVIPVMMQHYVLLQRNLIYTGVTRGKKLVVLVGEARALHMAVKNDKTRRRYTRLAKRLNSED
ncbi:ATP-dependent RecD-like DNA helicase [Deltaproteobacteria bacterium]|uniref:RecD-like DNA helicase n=1 Tax=Candidatus Desulfovibrio trichonymphae TaxID=1725232 RepID=A0A1J1DPG7_9BACT|nr:RecD-like DNA helicase [Candidatus Desulfovibrio trichonymphae]GHU91318.1 ATP-dependent RecD-like DNA helicase [Deltaproteobacteria bacterium]GHU95616.1 ATP-dependent RecD-like DNA helicase [Deltaproteobacteria bacterium]